MSYRLLIILSILTIFSCKNSEEKVIESSWIGGEIINPVTDYVIITKDNVLLDTVMLNEKNGFIYEVENAEPGLYSFNHNEYQIFYFEPKDSLLLRVNTLDFDESLTYTGKGSEKNNLLMEFFLTNEEENKIVQTWYQLNPLEFEKKIDSLKNERIVKLENFLLENETSGNFEEVAMHNINYDHYSKKEQYVTANADNLQNINFPSNFFDYRLSIDFNKIAYFSSYPYNRFLNRYFENLAFSKYSNNAKFDRNSFDHINYEVKLIDSMVSNDAIKNNLLRTNVRRYLLNEKDVAKEKHIEQLFSKMNNNPAHKNEIKRLFEAIAKLAPGNFLPEVSVVTFDNATRKLKSLISKPTVLYFWTNASVMQYKKLHNRAMELKAKYPAFDFIAINSDENFKTWKRIVKQNNFNPSSEYQFNDKVEAQQTLVLNLMTKAIIVDGDGKILDGNSNLLSNTIEEELLGFLNK